MRSLLLAILMAALLTLGGCACPPLVSTYGSPEETLANWQSHLCADDIDGEYRCLSAGFKRRIGNFETYHGARSELLRSQPFLARALARSDLPSRIVERQVDELTGQALLVLNVGGRRVPLGFARETTVLVEFADGPPDVGRSDRPLSTLLRSHGNRRWIDLDDSRLAWDELRLAGARAVLIEHRWKIDAIEGLLQDTATGP